MVHRYLPFVAVALASLAGAQDVVIFLMDDVGKVDLEELMADGRAPNFARIAQGGYQFTNASANPICQPTRHCIDFGDFHVRGSGRVCTGELDGTEPPLALVSLPELVGEPSAFFGKWHEGANPSGGPWSLSPQAHGWGLWRAGVPGGIKACSGSDYDNWIRVEDGSVSLALGTYQPGAQFSRWLEWWTATRAPRLAMFSTCLAHSPFHRPPNAWLPPNYPRTPTDRSKYEAMIAAMDVQIGRILAYLSPDDFLIVASDNGTPDELAGTTRAKGSTYERGIHVPLFIYGGWIRPGTSDALVHVVDVYATAAELTGAKADRARDSRSLAPLMLGSTRPVHDYILCGTLGHDMWPDDVCVRSSRYKLRRAAETVENPVLHEEFYDLALDPDELVDLIDDPAQQTVIARHRAWLDGVLSRSARR